jgi:hypothetical protein
MFARLGAVGPDEGADLFGILTGDCCGSRLTFGAEDAAVFAGLDGLLQTQGLHPQNKQSSTLFLGMRLLGPESI